MGDEYHTLEIYKMGAKISLAGGKGDEYIQKELAKIETDNVHESGELDNVDFLQMSKNLIQRRKDGEGNK